MLTLLLTLLPAAFAGMVGGIASGSPAAGLLLCAPGSSCIDEARWLAEHSSEAVTLPVVFFAEALSDPGDSYGTALMHRRAFDDGLAAALAAWATRDLPRTTSQLDAAERELAALSMPVPQQSLFDLYFLRGGVAHERGDAAAPAHFARAVAVAWNRTVRLPTPEGPVAVAYQQAQHRILHAKTGVLALAAPALGGVWNVDGVEVGGQAAALIVLSGAHRVIASVPGKTLFWATTATVDPGTTLPIAAEFPPQLPIDTLADLLRAEAQGATPDAVAHEVLRAWGAQRGVGALRVLYVAGTPFAVSTIAVARGETP